MAEHQDEQATVRARLMAFKPQTQEEMELARAQRDDALARFRPLAFDDANDPPNFHEIDPSKPLSEEQTMSLKPFVPDTQNPHPEMAVKAYQRLVEDTFRLAFREPHFTLEDLLPYRIRVAYRLVRDMARMRGFLAADASITELSLERWNKPEPYDRSNEFGGIHVPDQVRMIYDKSQALTEQFQTPTLSDQGEIEYLPGLALLPPPVPMRFRDQTTGKVLDEYDPEKDANLILYCKLLELVSKNLYLLCGSDWDKNQGRYGLMGLLDCRTVRLSMPSCIQMFAWEAILVEETLEIMVKEGISHTAKILYQKYGFSHRETDSFMRMAKNLARRRTESDAEEDRGVMVLRLEDLIRRSKEGFDLRVEAAALKQLALVQQLNGEDNNTMGDFIKVISKVHNERKSLPVITQRAIGS